VTRLTHVGAHSARNPRYYVLNPLTALSLMTLFHSDGCKSTAKCRSRARHSPRSIQYLARSPILRLPGAPLFECLTSSLMFTEQQNAMLSCLTLQGHHLPATRSTCPQRAHDRFLLPAQQRQRCVGDVPCCQTCLLQLIRLRAVLNKPAREDKVTSAAADFTDPAGIRASITTTSCQPLARLHVRAMHARSSRPCAAMIG